jgi:hypothetical protein
MKVVLLSKDLMFISRVKEVAAAHGGEAVIARNDAALAEALHSSQGGAVLIDLEKASMPLELLKDRLASLDTKLWRTIGFYSHVHVDAADQARAIGMQEVVPRSKFVQLLPGLFRN